MNKFRQIIIFLSLTIILFSFGCEKEAERNFPRVKTLAATAISEDGVTLNGEVLNFESMNISECGFNIYSGKPSDYTFERSIVVDYDSEAGSFEKTLEYGLRESTIYYFEAFAISGGVKAFGSSLSFTCQGSKPPVVLSISPKTGQAGDTIVVELEDHFSMIEGFTVRFDGLVAYKIGFENNNLEVIVPYLMTKKENPVTVEYYGNQCSFEDTFTLFTPEITSFSPESVLAGEIVTITGNNFHRDLLQNIVSFNQTRVTVLSASATELTVIAPDIFDQYCTINITITNQNGSSSESIYLVEQPIYWEQLSDFPGGKIYYAGGFSIGDYGYVNLGGYTGHIYYDESWRNNSQTDTWTSIEKFPGQTRIAPFSFEINGIGYVGGGQSLDSPSSVDLYDFYSYDPLTNTWTQIADFPGDMGDNSYNVWCETINNVAYLYFGRDEFFKLEGNPATWTRISVDCPNIPSGSFSFTIDETIYVLDYLNNVWAYNIIDNSWTKKSDFHGPGRWSGISHSVDGYGYIGLGKNSTTYFDDIWKYDPNQDSWVRLTTIPNGGRAYSYSYQIGDGIYIGGGYHRNDGEASVYLFTPKGAK